MTKVMMVASRNTSDRDMNTCPMMVSACLCSSGIGCKCKNYYLALLMLYMQFILAHHSRTEENGKVCEVVA